MNLRIFIFGAICILLCGCIEKESTIEKENYVDLDVENANNYCNTCLSEVNNTHYSCTINFRQDSTLYEGYCNEASNCQTIIHNSPYVCGLKEPTAFMVFGGTRKEALELIRKQCDLKNIPYSLTEND